ncbi:hypothetical protein [Jiangella alkaliphila]|uniref:Uncharacterized protein n=1 Tax=Jiangella alkaliphila TaxID=419479 RepID=A0A1H2LYQ7_9ACTN|nr:hypothetical protein [Jiangella alkaliphila]SDU86143.1 hypothetical protein SAMN04488563_6855 [Jiangella alkaliphila]
MRTSRAVIGVILALTAVTACTSDDDGGDGVEVELVAGGGDSPLAAEPAAGRDIRLDGQVTALTSGPDGSVWAVAGGDTLVEITADGDVRSLEPELPAGATAVTDLAVGPDGTVYAVADGASDASVFVLDSDTLQAALGVPAPPEELSARTPVSPDGTPAEEARLGQVVDIAADADGRLLFAESLLAEGGGLTGASMVRTVEDGVLVTLAGQPWEDPTTAPETDQIPVTAFPDGSAATEIDLLGPIALAGGPDGDVLVRTGWSVLSIADDGTAGVVLGADTSDDTLPVVTSDGPFAETVGATSIGYRAILDPKTFSVTGDGAIATGAIGNLESLTEDDHAPYEWVVTDGSERAQAIADSRASNTETHSTVVVTPGGEVATADIASDDAAWYGDGRLAAAVYDDESDESIIVAIEIPDDIAS